MRDYRSLILGIVLIGLMGCSGGENNDDSDNTRPEPTIVQQAVDLAQTMTDVTCNSVRCIDADLQTEPQLRDNGQIEQVVCVWECIEIETEDSTEYIWLRLVWERFTTACFEDEGEVNTVFVRQDLCVPNF